MSVFTRPRGIAFRVLIGLALLALAALIVCVLAIYSFRETSQKLDEVTSGFLPLVTVSAKLGTESIVLSNSAAEIIAVNTQTELETVGFRLSDQVSLIIRIKARLSSLGVDTGILDRFTVIETKLINDSNRLVRLVRHRIEIQENIDLHLIQLDRFINYFIHPPENSGLFQKMNSASEQTLSNENLFGDWVRLSLSAGLSALEISSIHNQTILKNQRQQFNQTWLKQKSLQRQLSLQTPQYNDDFLLLDSLWEDPDELYKLRGELLQQISGIQGTLGRHGQLSEELVEFIGNYSNLVQIRAEALSVAINDELVGRTQTLTLCFVLILLIAAIVFFYVDHHVVSRVQALDRKIRGYTTGISSYGQPRDKDEIEEIEASFSYFAESIEQRESELRAVSEIVSAERDRAEAANQSKTNLLRAASHDLRQPLHAMTLFLASLKKHVNTTQGLELHNAIATSIRQMGGTFDRVLDLSGTHSEGRVSEKHFLLNDVFSRLETEFALVATDSKSDLKIISNKFVACSDPDAVYRILGNLLTNAIRYAPGSHIHLYAELNEDQLEIFVRDTGPGIHDKNKSKVFDENYRLSEVEGGRGMGLAIARELAQSINSDLQLTSNHPSGAIFHFSVLRGDENFVEVHSGEVEPFRASRLEGLEILLVDDENSVLQSTKILLEGWGCEVHFFSDARKAIEKVEHASEQAVLITDLHLGRADSGLEIAKYFSKITGSKDRIIVISADQSKETKDVVTTCGYYLIRKPMIPGQLATLLRKFAKQSA